MTEQFDLFDARHNPEFQAWRASPPGTLAPPAWRGETNKGKGNGRKDIRKARR